MNLSAGKVDKTLANLVIFVAIIAIGLGVFYGSHKHTGMTATQREALSATLFDEPRQVSPFALTNHLGQPFTNQDLQGHWTFVFFGFTNCPNICPTTMSELAKFYKKLESEKFAVKPDVVMVSVDPERDSIERLKGYVPAFNQNFIGARGDKQQIAKLTRELGVLYMKVMKEDVDDAQSYDIDHSGTILLFNPQGQVFAVFSMPHDADEIAEDFEAIASSYS